MSVDSDTGSQESAPAAAEDGGLIPWGALLFWIIVPAFFIAVNWETVYPWALERLWLFIIICGLVLAAIIAIAVSIAWSSPTGQIGSVISFGIGFILALAATLWMLPPEYRVSMLRSVFLVIVILLPALLYFLFVALRKTSLLQEFFTNLGKLGLLGRRRLCDSEELERDRKIRVVTYLQKFEALYGTIPEELVDEILRKTNPDYRDRRDKDDLPNFELYESSVFTPEAIPVVVATLLIGLGWLLVLPPWPMDGITRNAVLKPTGDVALFAFLGAYFYALQMLYRRFIRRDLRANAYVSISERIILAVVGVWAVLQVFAGIPGSFFVSSDVHASLFVVGFVVGAFPPIAWQILQAVFRRVVKAEVLVPSLNSLMPLRELDGLTVWHEARLEEEDVENVQNMSTADLVDLMLHTRYPPDRIIDWVDQALLYTQLGRQNTPSKDGDHNPIKQLQNHGIRTASSLIVAYRESKQRGREEGCKFECILGEQGQSLPRLPSIIDALSTNPNLELVQRWNGTRSTSERLPQTFHAASEPAENLAATARPSN
jgi:hypothetical protein